MRLITVDTLVAFDYREDTAEGNEVNIVEVKGNLKYFKINWEKENCRKIAVNGKMSLIENFSEKSSDYFEKF